MRPSLLVLKFLPILTLSVSLGFAQAPLSVQATTATSVVSPKREFRGAWIATVTNIDWPTTQGVGVTSTQQSQLTSLLDNLKSAGFNAVIFQVRTECDAFYASPFEPWSYWLTGTQGTPPSPFYDPLQFAVQEAHKRGLEIHAWFNPYRAVRPSVYTRAGSHVSNVHPEWLLDFPLITTKILDPGLPQVRDYVATVISDIVRRYDVDGIHADDYFYPYPDGSFVGITTEDAATYTTYGGGDPDKAHWRRENVNKLLQQIHDSLLVIKPYVKFGMSPFGIWRNNVPSGISGLDAYNTIYCDAPTWLSRHIIDYLTPQLYWSIGGPQDYSKLQPWWADSTNAYGRHLYTGNATYRIGTSFGGATQLASQIYLNRANPKVQGSIQFSAKWIPANLGGWTDLMKSDVFAYPSAVPLMSWKGTSTVPNAPMNLAASPIPSTNLFSLSWDPPTPAADGDTAARYLVYRFPNGSPSGADVANSRNLIALEGGTSTVPSGRFDTTGIQYHFAVSALDRYNNEGPLTTATVTIPLVASAPVLAAPADSLLVFPKGGKLVWTKGVNATAYRCQVDTIASISATPFQSGTVTDTSFVPSGLAAQNWYHWRVASGGQGSSSNYTNVQSFKTGWPFPPTLISPLLAQNISRTPTIVWSKSTGSTFELKLTDTGTLTIAVDTVVVDTTCTISRVLNPSTIYTWTVAAGNAYGASDWAPESRFRTAPATLVEETSTLPTTYDLAQNYPNPFNPATMIRFSIAHEGKTSVRVFDLLGREVATLVDEQMIPGVYSVRFDADNLRSGTYFYVLTSGSTRIAKKMIVLK